MVMPLRRAAAINHKKNVIKGAPRLVRKRVLAALKKSIILM